MFGEQIKDLDTVMTIVSITSLIFFTVFLYIARIFVKKYRK